MTLKEVSGCNSGEGDAGDSSVPLGQVSNRELSRGPGATREGVAATCGSKKPLCVAWWPLALLWRLCFRQRRLTGRCSCLLPSEGAVMCFTRVLPPQTSELFGAAPPAVTLPSSSRHWCIIAVCFSISEINKQKPRTHPTHKRTNTHKNPRAAASQNQLIFSTCASKGE